MPVRIITRWLAGIELLLVSAGVLVLVWRPWRWLDVGGEIVFPALLATAMAAIVVVSLLRSRDQPELIGLSPKSWTRGWRSIVLITLPAVLGLFIIGALFGTVSPSAIQLNWYQKYGPTVILEQILLQCFFMSRSEQLFASQNRPSSSRLRRAGPIIMASLVFAAVHVPNAALAALTLGSGLFWTWHFQRYRNLPALIISHLLLGISAMVALGEAVLMNLTVGYGAWLRLNDAAPGTSPLPW